MLLQYKAGVCTLFFVYTLVKDELGYKRCFDIHLHSTLNLFLKKMRQMTVAFTLLFCHKRTYLLYKKLRYMVFTFKLKTGCSIFSLHNNYRQYFPGHQKSVWLLLIN